jgi:hypothetical protein
MKSVSRLLLAGLAACLLLRIAIIALPRSVTLNTKSVEAIADAREYVQLAGNLAVHRSFTRDSSPPYRAELFRTPLYPLLLAPAVRTAAAATTWGLLIQAVLSLLLVVLTWRLAQEMELSRQAADVAALLVGASVNLAFLATKLVTETLFTVILVIVLLLYARFLTRSRLPDLLAAGGGLGLLILTRPIALYLPLLLALHLVWRVLRRRLPAVAPLLLLAATSLTIAPWVARNWRAAHYTGVSTASQHNLYLYNAATVLASDENITLAQARDSMQAEATARFGELDSTDEAGYWSRLGSVASTVCFRRPLRTAVVQASGFIATLLSPLGLQPLLVHTGSIGYASAPPHVMQNTLRLLVAGKIGPAISLVWSGRLSLLPPFALVLLVLAAIHLLFLLVGTTALLARRSRGRLLWLLLPVLYFTLLPGPVGEARFRAPIEPLLCLLAAAGLVRQSGQSTADARRQ